MTSPGFSSGGAVLAFVRPVVPYTLALSFAALSAGDISGSLPTGSLPSFLLQGGSSSSESFSLLFKLEVFQKTSNYIKHENLKSMPSSAPETIDQSSSSVMSGVPCVGFAHSCNGRSLSGDGSHTEEVMLCWGLLIVEQARHEHISDEYKNRTNRPPKYVSYIETTESIIAFYWSE